MGSHSVTVYFPETTLALASTLLQECPWPPAPPSATSSHPHLPKAPGLPAVFPGPLPGLIRAQTTTEAGGQFTRLPLPLHGGRPGGCLMQGAQHTVGAREMLVNEARMLTLSPAQPCLPLA